MFTFHKPKVFRSGTGCCICGAKSSSSRFTDSKKYENVFEKCFDLEELRTGEICNACVLLVKRFIKLPPGSNRTWHHVVDARSGPGLKSMTRNKKRVKDAAAASEQDMDKTPTKRKHVYKRKGGGASSVVGVARTGTPEVPETRLDKRKQNRSAIKRRNPAARIEGVYEFSGSPYWTKETVCCGMVYRGQQGEVVLDERHYKPWACAHKAAAANAAAAVGSKADSTGSISPTSMVVPGSASDGDSDAHVSPEESLYAAAAAALTADAADAAKAGVVVGKKAGSSGDPDDEGFFDKPAASPSTTDCSTPPPPNLEIDESAGESMDVEDDDEGEEAEEEEEEEDIEDEMAEEEEEERDSN